MSLKDKHDFQNLSLDVKYSLIDKYPYLLFEFNEINKQMVLKALNSNYTLLEQFSKKETQFLDSSDLLQIAITKRAQIGNTNTCFLFFKSLANLFKFKSFSSQTTFSIIHLFWEEIKKNKADKISLILEPLFLSMTPEYRRLILKRKFKLVKAVSSILSYNEFLFVLNEHVQSYKFIKESNLSSGEKFSLYLKSAEMATQYHMNLDPESFSDIIEAKDSSEVISKIMEKKKIIDLIES